MDHEEKGIGTEDEKEETLPIIGKTKNEMYLYLLSLVVAIILLVSISLIITASLDAIFQ